MPKYQPCEKTIVMSTLGISPLYSDHSIKSKDLQIILQKSDTEFIETLKMVGKEQKSTYKVQELVMILSYCIKVKEMKYNKRRIKAEYFFVEKQKKEETQ